MTWKLLSYDSVQDPIWKIEVGVHDVGLLVHMTKIAKTLEM